MPNGTHATPTIIPMISYMHPAEAADWLEEAFSFREQLRHSDERTGRVDHVQLELGNGVIMLGTPSSDYQSPKRHRENCDDARKWSETPYVVDGLLVYVDDVDAHYEHAKQAGATMLSEPEDTPYGDRHYRTEDLEGHRWMFATHVRDVEPQDWGAETASA